MPKIGADKGKKGNEMAVSWEQLKFYIQDKKYGAYTTKDILKRVKVEKLTFFLKQGFLSSNPLDYSVMKCVISTQVKGWIRKKYLLVLDCDNFANKESVLEELRLLQIGYKVFTSSQDHYWIVTDFIGSIKKCLIIMKCIPGVDSQFIKCCETYGKIILRAFPKAGVRPQFHTTWQFQHSHLAGLWVRAFTDYWSSAIVDWLLNKQKQAIDTEQAIKKLETISNEILKTKAKEEEELKLEKLKPRRSLRIEHEQI